MAERGRGFSLDGHGLRRGRSGGGYSRGRGRAGSMPSPERQGTARGGADSSNENRRDRRRPGFGFRGLNRRPRSAENSNTSLEAGNSGNLTASAKGRKFPIGYLKLKEIANGSTSDIALSATSPGNPFNNLFDQDNLREGFLKLIVLALARTCMIPTPPAMLTKLLIMAASSKFFKNHVLLYIIRMPLTSSCTEQMDFKEPLAHIVCIIKAMLTRVPSSCNGILHIIPLLKDTVSNLSKISSIVDEAMVKDVDTLVALRDDMFEKVRNQAKTIEDTVMEEDPPDDFRDAPVFPSLDDINGKIKPFLRVNKAKGGYQDVQAYLDVQFRLLREDFICPLREGITEYLEAVSKGEGHGKFQDIKVYHEVKILYPEFLPSGIAYAIHFNNESMKNVRWQSSKRLIYGSLVCLSKDNFQSLLFGTVIERNVEELEIGIITINIEEAQEMVSAIKPEETFVMVESAAFFEAYKHVLKGLKEMDEDNIPFKDYLVNCENIKNHPKYLEHNSLYDLSVLANGDDDSSNEENEEKSSGESKTGTSKVNILDPESWPLEESLPFDHSQYEAIKMALTREFALIQGPPGTGKTYIGLKIVKALLNNRDNWSHNGDKRPILIVCYTNHALDQFIEGIEKFCKEGIVRVGGRSKSETLEKYLLKNLRKEACQNKKTSHAVRQGKFHAIHQLEETKNEVEPISATLKMIGADIVKEDILIPFMGEDKYEQLTQTLSIHECKKVKYQFLLTWLEGYLPYLPGQIQQGANFAGNIDIVEDEIVDDETDAGRVTLQSYLSFPDGLDEPCKERLICGHMCIGLQGERCPDKCRVCDKDEVTKQFFGDEDQTDARFVQLEDCGHIFEVNALDYYINIKGTQMIKGEKKERKFCPKCRTFIQNSKRYGGLIMGNNPSNIPRNNNADNDGSESINLSDSHVKNSVKSYLKKDASNKSNSSTKEAVEDTVLGGNLVGVDEEATAMEQLRKLDDDDVDLENILKSNQQQPEILQIGITTGMNFSQNGQDGSTLEWTEQKITKKKKVPTATLR